MRRPIIAGESPTIHAEDNRQVLQAHIVHDRIEGTLQEGGIDGAERTEAHRSQARREDDAVLLGDAHVENTCAGDGDGRDQVPFHWAWRRWMATTLLFSSASLTSVSAKTSE